MKNITPTRASIEQTKAPGSGNVGSDQGPIYTDNSDDGALAIGSLPLLESSSHA